MFGAKVRELRESKGFYLRQMAAHIEVDTAYESKIETGSKTASRDQVVGIANFLREPKEQLITIWLADRIEQVVEDESLAVEALKEVLKRKTNE